MDSVREKLREIRTETKGKREREKKRKEIGRVRGRERG